MCKQGAEIVIRFLIFLTHVVGKMAGILSLSQSALGRAQTRLLTRAQFHGWVPETEADSKRLVVRQYNLFAWRMARIARKKQGPKAAEAAQQHYDSENTKGN